MSRSSFLKGTFILTATGFIMRLFGFLFKIFLSRTAGAAAVGTYQLILPIMTLCHAVSVSGIEITLSKNVSKKNGLAVGYAADCTVLSCILGTACMLLLNIFARPISAYYLHNDECAPLLRIFSFSIPLTCIHSMFYSYYIGKGSAIFPALSQLFEQLVRFAALFFFSLFTGGAVTAVLATVTGELFSVLMCTLFVMCRRKRISYAASVSHKEQYGVIIRHSFPVTVNRLSLNFIQSLESSLIPMMLILNGSSRSEALGIFGIITGMALPLVLFPATVTNSFALMLIPAVSKNDAHTGRLNAYGRTSFCFSLVLGLSCIVFFNTFGGKIAARLFSNGEIVLLSQKLSLICPFVFISSTFKSILNALGKSYRVLVNNMFSEVLCLFFIVFCIPRYGSSGYIAGIILSQCLNTVLSLMSFAKELRRRKECH